MSVESAWADIQYFVALVEWLIEHKSDHEADAEIVELLEAKPWLIGALTQTLQFYAQSPPAVSVP